jgi:hypothetical protein
VHRWLAAFASLAIGTGPALAQAPSSTPPADNTNAAQTGAEGALGAVAAPAEAQPAPAAATAPAIPDKVAQNPGFQMGLTTLDALHKSGKLSDAEYNSAMQDLIEVGSRAATSPTLTIGGFKTILYGFAEGDVIHDDTQSFNELAGANPISKPGSNVGDNGRTMFAVRNSRIGFKINAPEVNGIRASGQMEMDFFGNQPGAAPATGTAPAGGLSATLAEASFFNNPTFRVRHMLAKIESDYINVWIGQTWELIGWQSQFQPNTVAIQGVPGEIYSRTAQVRLDHTFHLGPASLELAAAALRPPQMNAEVPDFQGGAKLSIDSWTGVQTVGQTGTSIQPASIAISGGTRQFKLAQSLTVDDYAKTSGSMGAIDVMLPVVPAKERQAFAVTIVGEAATGTGDAEIYTNLKGGAGIGAPGTTTCPTGCTSAAYNAAALNDVDTGLVGWANGNMGTTAGSLSTVDWKSMIISAQVYLPPSGKLWVSGSYSNLLSDNVQAFGTFPGTWWHETWWDLNLFADITPAARLGLEYSRFSQTFGDGSQRNNNRVQFSGWFIF